MHANKKSTPLLIIGEAIENFSTHVGALDAPANLSLPPYEKHGDLTTNLPLRISKIIDKAPINIAEDLCEYLNKHTGELIEKAEAVNPGFVNIFLSKAARKEILDSILYDSESFFTLDTDKNTNWVIEHTSPNPNKAMHLGHLRNNLVGMSLSNLIEVCQGKVIRDAVDNNRGIAIAKAMYGFLALMRKSEETTIDIKTWVENKELWYTPEEKNMRPDVFVTYCYTGAEALLKAEGAENNQDTAGIKDSRGTDSIIRQMVLDWENKDKNTWKLWEHILNYSYAGMNLTLKRLGNKWDNVWHEHEHYEKGKEYVEEGLKKGIFKKLDDGAVLTQIEEKYNIPETILLKNDGTALYITQDIALTDLKRKKYKADKLVWVIGPEQSLAMQQLFAVCEQLGIGKITDFIHISYGYMGLKDDEGRFKKMSSRAGTVLLIDDLIDTVKERIIEARGEENIPNDLAEKIALAAVKFSILKCERSLNVAFSIEESVSINGDSGVYVLYTYARIQSILREGQNRDIKPLPQTGECAVDVVRILNSYPMALSSARKHLSVHPVSHYLLSLCAEFNKFYGEEKVLDDGSNVPEKLAVLEAVAKTISHGLDILGIPTVERM